MNGNSSQISQGFWGTNESLLSIKSLLFSVQAYNNLYNYYPEFWIGDAYTANTLYSHSSFLLKIKFNK